MPGRLHATIVHNNVHGMTAPLPPKRSRAENVPQVLHDTIPEQNLKPGTKLSEDVDARALPT